MQSLIDSIYSVDRLKVFNVCATLNDPHASYYVKERLAPLWQRIQEVVDMDMGRSYHLAEDLASGRTFKDLLAMTKAIPTEEEKELALSMQREPVDSQTRHVVAARCWLSLQPSDTLHLDYHVKEALIGHLEGLGFSKGEIRIACNWVSDRMEERERADRTRRYESIRSHLRQVMRDYRSGDLTYNQAASEFGRSDDHYAVWRELGENPNAFSVVAPSEDDAEVAGILAAMAAAAR